MTTYTVTDGQYQSFSFSDYVSGTTEVVNASGSSRIYFNIDFGRSGAQSPVTAVLNLAPNARVDASFAGQNQSTLTVNGDATTAVTDDVTNNFQNLTSGALSLSIQPDVLGTGTFNLDSGASLGFGRSVASGITVNLNSGASNPPATLGLGQPAAFKGAVNFTDGNVILAGLNQATDYDLSNGVLTLYGGPGDGALDTLRLVDNSPEKAGLAIRLVGNDVQIVEQGSFVPTNDSAFKAGAALTQHVTPVVTNPPPPSAPQIVTVRDTTTGTDLPDTSTPYTGPVAGVASQFIAITPDSLNVTAKADNLFVKTGSGNDAVALHGGTNVVDSGAGSNFLTSGGGFDTFFLDSRNIPANASAAGPVPGAIWDTIQNFGHSDAVTVFGIGPATALDWQANQGAVGHTGLTLHANLPNGSEASLTLAGIDSKAGLQLSYGQTGGANYLYIKAA